MHLTVAKIMSPNVVTVHQDTALMDAAKHVTLSGGIRHLVVVDGEGVVVGVFSQRDLIRAMTVSYLAQKRSNQGDTTSGDTIRDFMTSDVISVAPKTSISEAARILAANKIGCLPITDDLGRPQGIVSVVDILNWVAAHPQLASIQVDE